MKYLVLLLLLAGFISSACTPEAKPAKNTDPALIEKNKKTALRNQVVVVVQEAQKLEQEGRSLDVFRTMPSEKNNAECMRAVAERTVRLEDFKSKSSALPENYSVKLLPIFDDLDKCVSCTKTAVENCKKARAMINEVIVEFFPKDENQKQAAPDK